jgi:membrane protein
MMIGQRISTFIVKEFINSLTGAWIIVAPLLITATGFLWWYNSFHRIGLMLVGFFVLLTTYIMAMCLSCWGTAKVLSITPLISAIKGGVPGKQLIWSAYVVRLGIILLTCSLSFSLISHLAQYSIRVKEAPLWQQHDQAIALFISSTAGSKYYETLGPLLRDMERENKLILSQPQWNLGLHNSPEDLPQLLVNTEYAKNELGFSPKKSGVVYVLHPLDAPQEDIDKAVNSVKLQYGDYQGLNIETSPQPVDFSAFSYQSEFSGFSHDLTLKRPIVTVLPYGLEMVTDRNMSALTTSRHLLLKDEATAKQLQSSTNSLNLIAGWRPAQSQWQEVTAELGVDTRAATLNLGILLVVLIVLILSCVTTFSLQYRDRLRASLVIGVPFICAYIGFLIVEMTFMLVPFIYLGYRQSAYNAVIAEGVPRAIELSRSAAVTPTIVALTIGLAVFWLITAIWLAERRYTRAWHTQ